MTTDVRVFARLPRDFVAARGADAEDYLQRMVSNDVAALAEGESCEALLLTPKGRVIAPLRVLRRGADDFLLLTEPGLGSTVLDHLGRFRFAARVVLEEERHASALVLGPAAPPSGVLAVRNDGYGAPGWELLDADPPAGVREASEDELERRRIRAGTPRFGHEIDDRVLPAEAGLVERAVSLTKGCYPGQEPIARLHYRGHANRGLRVLRLEASEPPERDAEIRYGGKAVGRVTSAVRDDGRVLALAYVRAEVPADAVLEIGAAEAHSLD